MRNFRAFSVAALAATVLALFAAGCGADGTGDQPTTTPGVTDPADGTKTATLSIDPVAVDTAGNRTRLEHATFTVTVVPISESANKVLLLSKTFDTAPAAFTVASLGEYQVTVECPNHKTGKATVSVMAFGTEVPVPVELEPLDAPTPTVEDTKLGFYTMYHYNVAKNGDASEDPLRKGETEIHSLSKDGKVTGYTILGDFEAVNGCTVTEYTDDGKPTKFTCETVVGEDDISYSTVDTSGTVSLDQNHFECDVVIHDYYKKDGTEIGAPTHWLLVMEWNR